MRGSSVRQAIAFLALRPDSSRTAEREAARSVSPFRFALLAEDNRPTSACPASARPRDADETTLTPANPRSSLAPLPAPPRDATPAETCIYCRGFLICHGRMIDKPNENKVYFFHEEIYFLFCCCICGDICVVLVFSWSVGASIWRLNLWNGFLRKFPIMSFHIRAIRSSRIGG